LKLTVTATTRRDGPAVAHLNEAVRWAVGCRASSSPPFLRRRPSRSHLTRAEPCRCHFLAPFFSSLALLCLPLSHLALSARCFSRARRGSSTACLGRPCGTTATPRRGSRCGAPPKTPPRTRSAGAPSTTTWAASGARRCAAELARRSVGSRADPLCVRVRACYAVVMQWCL
jgi:hypothetical protein